MKLEEFFAEYSKIAVAFSGGVDSAYLLYAAAKSGVLVKAYYVNSQFQPAFELADAKALAQSLGVDMEVISVDILSCPEVAANPSDRCYHCKKALFTAIAAAAVRDGFSCLADGTNASDDAGDRPGMRALRELSVRSPLRECGLTKDEIRARSEAAGLFTWNKPAYACLATRVPAGEVITEEKLEKTERAETFLYNLGFRDFRVRMSGGNAVLQLRETDLPLVAAHRQNILRELKKDYAGVVLDLEVRK